MFAPKTQYFQYIFQNTSEKIKVNFILLVIHFQKGDKDASRVQRHNNCE